MPGKINILIAGRPGIGKTTIVKKFVQLARGKFKLGGFYTEEIRSAGRRTGFKIITVDGKEGILADIHIKSRFKVGKYGVNIQDINSIAVPSMDLNSEIIIIDEIGKMECFSELFVGKIFEVLNSNRNVLATIKEKGDEIIDEIKSRRDVKILNITFKNRDEIPFIILDLFTKQFYNYHNQG
jgi:nucleoside-triphosphatase